MVDAGCVVVAGAISRAPSHRVTRHVYIQTDRRTTDRQPKSSSYSWRIQLSLETWAWSVERCPLTSAAAAVRSNADAAQEFSGYNLWPSHVDRHVAGRCMTDILQLPGIPSAVSTIIPMKFTGQSSPSYPGRQVWSLTRSSGSDVLCARYSGRVHAAKIDSLQTA